MAGDHRRVAVVGGRGAGKSFLTFQLVGMSVSFTDEYSYPTEDSYRKLLSVDGVICDLDLFDPIACQEDFPYYHETLRATDGFLCIYSITSLSSFEEIASVREQILRAKEGDLLMVLVGTKCDLEEERQVTEEEGLSLAESFGCSFFETSAKDCVNVESPYSQLVREIRKHNEMKKGTSVRAQKKQEGCSLC